MTRKTTAPFMAFFVMAAAAAALTAGFFASCKNIVDAGPTPVYGVKLNLADPTITYYEVGEHFTSGGLTVYEVYNDNTSEVIRDGYTLTWNGSPLAEGSTAITAAKGVKKVTVSYDGLQAAFYINVEVTLLNITVTKDPNKTVYLVGEPLDTTGLVVAANYDDGSSEAITDYEMFWNEVQILNGNTDITKQAGIQTIKVDYGYQHDSFEILVDALVPTSIAVTEAPDKTIYAEDEKFDTTGMIVTASMNDGTFVPVPAGDGTSGYMMIWNNQQIENGDTNVTDLKGAKLISVEYRGTFTNFTIIVGAMTLDHISIVSEPNKTTYGNTRDNKYDFTGLQVSATLEDGDGIQTTVMIPHQDADTPDGYLLYEVDGKSDPINTGETLGFTGTETGTHSIKAKYTYTNKDSGEQTEEASFTIYVIDDNAALQSIAVNKQPNKTEYITGYAFSSAGLVVTATFSNPSVTQNISHKTSSDGYGYVMSYNGAEINDGNTTITQTEGDKDVIVSYTFNNVTKTAQFTIHVTQSNVVSLNITHQPNTTSYSTKTPQAFSTAGLEVTATFNDGSQKVVGPGDGKSGYQLIWNNQVITDGNTQVTSVDQDNPAGLRTIDVEYQGIGTTFQINVVEFVIAVTGVTVTHDPNKTEYEVGEAFDMTGLVVYASYNDGTYSEVPYTGDWTTGYELIWNNEKLENGNTLITSAPGLKIISVIYSSETLSTNIEVMVDPELKYITITQDPTRVYYGAGYPTISTTGLVVVGLYDTGSATLQQKTLTVNSSNLCNASGGSITINTPGAQSVYVKYTDTDGKVVISSDQTSPVTGHAYFTLTVLPLDKRIADDYGTNDYPALHENPIVMYVSETLQQHTTGTATGYSDLTGKTLQVGTGASQNPPVVLSVNVDNAYLQLGAGSTLTVYGQVYSKVNEQNLSSGAWIWRGLRIGDDNTVNEQVININGTGVIFAQDLPSPQQASSLFTIAPTGASSNNEKITLNIADTDICGLITASAASAVGITIPSWAKYTSAVNSYAPVFNMTAGTLNLSKSASIAANRVSAIVAGGGAYTPAINLSDQASIQACIANNGYTGYNGGGVVLFGGAQLSLAGSAMITNCYANSSGGGVYMKDSASVMNIYDNAYVSGCTAGDGGGVYIAGGTLNMDSRSSGNYASIQGNKATGNGGGVYMLGGTLTMSTTAVGGVPHNSIRGNTAANSGGGIYYNVPSSTLSLNSGFDGTGGTWGDYYTVSGNKAASGGGIFVAGGTVKLGSGEGSSATSGSSGVVGGNQATGSNGNGGGVYVDGSGSFGMTGYSVVRGNTASNNGGGVYVNGASATAEIMNAAKIYGGNSASGTDFSLNTSADGGGGIYIAGGTVTITDTAQVSGNTAALCGGGINVQGGTLSVAATLPSTRVFSGAPAISGNTTTSTSASGDTKITGGGGVFCYNGTVNIGAVQSDTTILAAKYTIFVQNNTSSGSGGGFYMGGTGVLNLTGNVEVKGNHASFGGALMMNNASKVSMYYYTGPDLQPTRLPGWTKDNDPTRPAPFGFPALHGNSSASQGGGVYFGYPNAGTNYNPTSCQLYIEIGRIQGEVDETDDKGTVWTHNSPGNVSAIYTGDLGSGWIKLCDDCTSSGTFGGGYVGNLIYTNAFKASWDHTILPRTTSTYQKANPYGSGYITEISTSGYMYSGETIRGNITNFH